MALRKTIAAAICASVALTTGPASAGDGGKILGGIALGIIAGQAIQNGQKRKKQRSGGMSSAQRQQNRDVQTALNQFGFPVGAADGSLGPKSRAAIGNYQSYMGYPVTGHLTDYERSVLVGGLQRYNAGGGAAYPEVIANEGTRGLLKAFNDPNYVNRYRQDNNQNNNNNQNNYATNEPVVENAGLGTGVLPELDLGFGSAPSSMATHCEVVTGLTQVNGGAMLAGNVTDPEQALGEQFCEARSYAITESQSLVAKARATEDQIKKLCTQIKDNMEPAVGDLGTKDLKAVATQAQDVAKRIYGNDMNAAAGYGRICLGTGYRQDDAGMALGGALSMVAAGHMPYAEVMGHHLRWGFGTARSAGASEAWHNAALSALLNDGAQPAFLPSKTAERTAIIQASLAASSGGQAYGSNSGDSGVLSLPALNLGD